LWDATEPQGYRTDDQIGQDNLRRYAMDLYNPVFWITAFLILIFVIGTLMAKPRNCDKSEHRFPVRLSRATGVKPPLINSYRNVGRILGGNGGRGWD
jgi:hypothetical protein